MYQSVLISIFLVQLAITKSTFLEIENNYQKPKLERNSVLNKGVWVKNVKENDKSTANFLFRGNTVDVDNLLQGDFNPFEDGNGPTSTFISSYVERSKRSPDSKRLRRFRKSLTNCPKGDCNSNIILDEKPSLIKSKLLTKLKPASVFNDYPYEIALLLGNNKGMLDKAKNYSTYVINEMIRDDNKTIAQITELDGNYTNGDSSTVNNDDPNEKVNYTVNSVPKRSMTTELDERRNVKRIELGDFNNSNALSDDIIHSEIVAGEIGRLPNKAAVDRDIFDKDDKVWRQNAPLPKAPLPNIRMRTKEEESKVVRPVTERGLVKVLSMLTKTFKKIMKQHSDIKDIHKKLSHMNDDFVKSIDVMTLKFKDFDSKYANLAKLTERLRSLESKLNAKEQHYKAKERELSKNLVDFEIQQKKFLQQQRQFYNIQKLMLAQNERINAKQNSIAKTQSEISHRQNNFARILKKAKQIYVDNKYVSNIKTTYAKPYTENERNHTTEPETITYTTTGTPKTAEPVKINLFSIPNLSLTKLKNQDQMLLDEKDEQPVDDLVYKYYFNNTFIDNLMKHFLSNFLNAPDSADMSSRTMKSKRDEKIELKEITTLLLPVNKTETSEFSGKTLNRERRWISHHSRRKWRKKNKGKGPAEIMNTDDNKLASGKPIDNVVEISTKETKTEKPHDGKDLSQLHKTDAFMTMAKNFCNGIGQNQNSQILDWCVEKALRKLQNIDIKVPPPPPAPLTIPTKGLKPKRIFEAVINTKPSTLEVPRGSQGSTPQALQTKSMTQPPRAVTTPPELTITKAVLGTTGFFPDNEKLESNLKQFDLTPDAEGNVYYDGSLHASDLIKDKASDDSDIMPGLESNSKIDTIDPEAFDTKAMRRAMIRRMKYENMFKRISKL